MSDTCGSCIYLETQHEHPARKGEYYCSERGYRCPSDCACSQYREQGQNKHERL